LAVPGGSDSVGRNVAAWTQANAEYTDRQARAQWAREEITWGMFSVAEADVGVLGDVAGLDVVELGCGTAYFSAWLARRGARPVGVDPTRAQLETAVRCQEEFGLDFPLIEAPGEAVPLPDASFDLVISEYGASLWAEPTRWIPEAARLLRPGGRLIFLTNSVLVVLCSPSDDSMVTEHLVRSQFDLYRLEWPDDDSVEFHPTHGEWIRLLRANGFVIEKLVEPPAPAGATTHEYYGWVSADWARKWPAEEIWAARKQE
jgi:ubiquinone/menaquinone biosynthesis C-methylase UbiE